MPSRKLLTENELASLAKQLRTQANESRAQAARNLDVSWTTIFNAEESPNESLLKARIRLIEAYSPFTVEGPVYFLKRKSKLQSRSTQKCGQ